MHVHAWVGLEKMANIYVAMFNINTMAIENLIEILYHVLRTGMEFCIVFSH